MWIKPIVHLRDKRLKNRYLLWFPTVQNASTITNNSVTITGLLRDCKVRVRPRSQEVIGSSVEAGNSLTVALKKFHGARKRRGKIREPVESN